MEIISSILAALASFLKWRAAQAEIDLKKCVWNERKKIIRESIELEREIAGLRFNGRNDIADQLRDLDISSTAFFTKNYLNRSGILPAGESLGPAERPHVGHLGADREYGRLTVNYDDAGETIDLYAGQ